MALTRALRSGDPEKTPFSFVSSGESNILFSNCPSVRVRDLSMACTLFGWLLLPPLLLPPFMEDNGNPEE